MMITVPMLTNTKPITKGTELVFEIGTPVKKENLIVTQEEDEDVLKRVVTTIQGEEQG